MKQIPVQHDTRSGQKFTKEKLDTMRPSDVAAVAAQRGYKVDPTTHRISHAEFLRQQEESKQYEGDESHTESGEVPDDYPVQTAKSFDASTTFVPSVQGGVGGLPPAEPVGDGTGIATEPLGKQSSELDHTGHQEGSFTHGAVVEGADTSAGAAQKPLVNVPVEGQRA